MSWTDRLAAGSAGDRLGHGEERDGAQARNHSAEGESLVTVHTFYENLVLHVISDMWKVKTIM